MTAPEAAPPLARQVVLNALTLAVGYLAAGLVVEGLRTQHPSRTILTLSFALDALPAQVLSVCGMLEPLRDAYLSGRVSEAGLRVIFACTALAVIFSLAVVLGVVGAFIRASFRRGTSFGE